MNNEYPVVPGYCFTHPNVIQGVGFIFLMIVVRRESKDVNKDL